MNGDMVRAVLDGTKTQTRRPVSIQPPSDEYRLCIIVSTTGPKSEIGKREFLKFDEDGICVTGRYGKCFGSPCAAGDTLWVRETFASGVSGCPDGLSYKADHRDPKGDGPANPMKWTPSIHMPREAARIFLPVKSVRVERLREISEADAKAEGLMDGDSFECAQDEFRTLWDSIYSKRGLGWDANPWVWVIEWDKPEVKHASPEPVTDLCLGEVE
jgi:hypothetical protein